jgi:selenocysteine lyase/cysteine desulfurase
MDKFNRIRSQYPGLNGQAYLDTATTGLVSKDSYLAMREQLDKRHEVGLNIKEYYGLWDQADKSRSKLALFLGAEDDEVFYGKDASDMLNALTANIVFPAGSNVITPDISFPSTRNAWLAREKDGLEVRYAVADNGAVSYESLTSLVDEHTIAIALCFVEPSSGFRHDLDRIGKLCQDKGILLVIDATQCISAMHIDVKSMHIDFFVSSTYKWMNNVFGFAVGYMSRELLDRIDPKVVGWVGVRNRTGDFNTLNYQVNEGAQRFETGGLNWIGLAGLNKAIDIVLELDTREIQTYILGLTDYLYESVESIEGLDVVKRFDASNRSNIVYLEFPKELKLNDGILIEHGIRVHVAGNTQMRVGMHFYNNRQDIDALIEFMKQQISGI